MPLYIAFILTAFANVRLDQQAMMKRKTPYINWLCKNMIWKNSESEHKYYLPNLLDLDIF